MRFIITAAFQRILTSTVLTIPAAAVALSLIFPPGPGLFAASIPYRHPVYQAVKKGLRYGRVELADPPLIYHVVRIDLREPGLEVRPVRGKGREETIENMSDRLLKEGRPLLAAINGDYFTPGNEINFCPWGILVESGDMIFSPTDKSALLIEESGYPRIAVPEFKGTVTFSGEKKARVAAVNRRREISADECVLFTLDWNITAAEYEKGMAVTVVSDGEIRNGVTEGKVTQLARMPVQAPIPENGYVLVFNEAFSSGQKRPVLGETVSLEISWTPDCRQAIGGGPRLVRDSKVSVEMDEENFSLGKAAYLSRGRHPRSAAGIDAEKKELIMLVAEGRSRESRGLKLSELADLMLFLRARQALAFDGGRSVGLFLDGEQIVKGKRIICDALGVFQRGEE